LVAEDPVGLGLVASIARPGGNLTGINLLNSELVAKRLELLRELVPRVTRVAVLVNRADEMNTGSTLRDAETAASAFHRLPASYSQREVAEIGGLMSYGANVGEAFRQLGVYAGRILKGAMPADLPVLQSSKFELVINAHTAGMLGLTVPDKLLATADEVIE
jgi:putative tryptophan/tyrosine transport system substrate-binding protein